MRVVVVRLVLTFFVMGLMLVLVLGVLVALLGGVLACRSMPRAWFECLVATIRRGFVLLCLLPLIVVATTIAVIVILPIVVVVIVLIALPAVATVTSVTLSRDTANLLIIPLARLMMYLASHGLLN
jgi:hypothetical protein